MRALLLGVLSAWLAVSHAQIDSYLCTADQAAGFAMDTEKRRWRATNIDVGKNQYIIKKNADVMGRIPRTITRVGEQAPAVFCDDDVGGEDMFLECDDVTIQFYFSRKTMRYMLVYADGFAVESDQGDARMPYIEIGTCAPL